MCQTGIPIETAGFFDSIDPKRALTCVRQSNLSGRGVPIGDRATTVKASYRNAAHCRLAKVNARDRAPTKTRLKAQVASRLNQLRDTNLRPR
jgi:hypothetical protein